jgi:hypothetical protein
MVTIQYIALAVDHVVFNKNKVRTLQIINPKPLLPPVTTATRPLTPNNRAMSTEDILRILS